MIKAVIFDFGGVIVPDRYGAQVQVRLRWLTAEKQKIYQETEIAANRGRMSKNDFFVKFQEIFNSNFMEDLDASTDQFYCQPDQQILELAKRLKPAVKVGLLSNNFPFWVAVAKRQDYLRIFDAAVFSSDVGLVKPEKEIYHLAAQRLGVYPEECVFIDDHEVNLKGALAASIGGTILYRGAADLSAKLAELLPQANVLV